MAKKAYDASQVHELLVQALETEAGGIKVYETALSCAVNDDLEQEWMEYLEETRRHHEILLGVFEDLGLDPAMQSPGRAAVALIGESLVEAMETAKHGNDPVASQLVATECVVLAETKDHANWELIGHVAEHASGDIARVLKRAHQAVEKDEDHHLYHTKGWSRELWIESLGFPAVLPPPEEIKHVETAIGASRAEQARDQMLGRKH